MGYIGLNGILQLLRVSKGPDGRGEYLCKCPAHDDKKASLSVSEGQKGIILKCHAGCSTERICGELRIPMRDLFYDKNFERAPIRVRTAKTYDSLDAAFGHIGAIQAVYPYTDKGGKLLFEVVRIMTDAGKTFRQCRPAYPERGKFPIICNLSDEMKNAGILYRWPDVDAAIRDGRTVYVVEGEKDADTMAAMGYAATTSHMGAGNWKQAHAEHLRGADVVIVPDNDSAGIEKYESSVLSTLSGIAVRVRVVHLNDGYPELPEHGDITDLVGIVGTDAAKEIFEKLLEKAGEANLYQRAIAVYNAIPGYGVNNGCICQRTDDSYKTLGTFVALPVQELTTDDGAEVRKSLKIAGWTADGRTLPELTVPVNKFAAMSWPLEGWGLTANIMPGNTVKDKLRSVIAGAGAQTAERVTVYSHTGWRELDGKWCYLHNGGCIGADAISVSMDGGMAQYSLTDAAELEPIDAAISAWTIAEVLPKHISIPMLGVTFLAPLREFLLRAWAPPAFVTFLKGKTQTRKTTAAALFLNFFGAFGEKNLPSSFNDTANYIRTKAFLAKDMLLLVDDYHPSTALAEKRRMDSIVQSLTRAFGDLAERGRLSSDLSLQVAKPPRSLCMMIGEDMPDVGASGEARFYMIEVDNHDIAPGDALTDLQQAARRGELRAAMKSYIEWLIPQAGSLPGRLGELFIGYRRRSAELLKRSGAQGRAVENVAQIMIGLTMMLGWYEDVGLLDHDSAAKMLESFWPIVAGNSRRQADAGGDETPVMLFTRAISEMLASKTMTVVDISPGSERHTPDRGMAGYADQQYYYLMPESAFGMVTHFYRDQDRFFPLSRAALYKQLRDENMIDIAGDGKTTRVKRTPDGKTQRLLWIPRWVLDGKRESVEQQRMGFTDVSDDEIPEELK